MGYPFIVGVQAKIYSSGTLILWVFVCFTAFAVVQTALQAAARTLFAISRDHGLPDRGLFGIVNEKIKIPVYAVWAITFLSML